VLCSYKNIAAYVSGINWLSLDLVQNRFSGFDFVSMEIYKTWNVYQHKSDLFCFCLCTHLDKCVVVNSGSVYWHFCILFTALYQSVSQIRWNGGRIPFKLFLNFVRTFVKIVRKSVKFFVFIRSYFSLKPSKTFWRSVKTIWQNVYTIRSGKIILFSMTGLRA
jgi:hypothetical protein